MVSYMHLGNNDHNILGSKPKENKYEFDYSKETFDIDAKCDSHASLARLVKEKSKVLDVGCSTGKLGSILKDFKNCIVDGIEYESSAFEVLKNNKSYNNIYNISFLDNNSKEFKKIKKEKYDYVIFGDVLEHLIEPWIAILNAYELLNNNGKILVSIPNIAHIDIIKGLINKDFNYKDLGLLDNTHIRFFTEKSFVDMIKNINDNNNCNIKVTVKDRIMVKPSYMDDIENNLSTSKSDIFKDYYPLQVIFELEKVKNKKDIKYIYDNTNIDRFEKLLNSNEDGILNNNIESLKKELEEQKRLYEDLNHKYLDIVNSKGWKTILKIRNIKHKIIRK